MICELYETDDGSESCFSPVESYVKCPQLKLDIFGQAMKKVWEVEGDSWYDCFAKYEEFQDTRE
jgi:hypothetical protein